MDRSTEFLEINYNILNAVELCANISAGTTNAICVVCVSDGPLRDRQVVNGACRLFSTNTS
ncbi:MAG: hypothetical protein JWM21_1768 [Acidobacteria bacterium]|nr:hypothetical protein [Acidobacteriota bacterium]